MSVVSSGASQQVNAGVVSDLHIYGSVFVRNPGIVISSVIEDGGVLTAGATSFVPPVTYLSSGGTISASTISSGGSVLINIRGVANGNTVMGGGTMAVSGDSDSGTNRFGSAINTTVSNGGALVISRWGRGYSNTALSGGTVVLRRLGEGYNDSAEFGGMLLVSSGATEIASSGIVANAQVSAGGTVIASTSGIVSNAVISNGGSALVTDSGLVSGGTVLDNGYIYISQGLYSGGTIASGGTGEVARAGTVVEPLLSGGTLIAGKTTGTGNPWYTSTGGTVVSGNIISGGYLVVSNGGTGIENTVGSGGTLQANGWSYVTPVNGAPPPGVLSNALILDGGTMVLSRGVGYDTIVSSGGVLSNGPGGTSYNATAQSGGSILLYQSGVGYNDTGESGGTIVVSSGGTEIASGGTVINVQVSAAGTVVASTSGVVSNAVVSNGGSGLILNNGVISSATVESGGYISVESGMISAGSVNIGGSIFVRNGGTAAGLSVSGGTITAGVTTGTGSPWYTSAGGTILSNTVEAGGILTVSNGGNASNNTVGSGGTIVAAGWAYTTPVNGAPAAGTANSNYISSGGTLVLRNGANGSRNIIGNGAIEYISSGSTETGALINSGGTISIPSTSALVSGILRPHGTISFPFLEGNITSANITSTGLLTVYTGASASSIQLAGSYSVNEFAYLGKSLTLTCYLEGTNILTARGPIPVENLQIGDVIVCWDPERRQNIAKAVKWVGSQRNTIKTGKSDDEAGYLVRFASNALGDELPLRDLWVTPEHCMYIDGYFIPSRMLVNGINVTYDKSKTDYTVYHIETEGHSVVYAEGARSESYLDTGNRNNFSPTSNLITLGSRDVLSWDKDAAACLAVSRSIVEPIFNRIAERAGANTGNSALVRDYDICLLTDRGTVYRPLRTNKNQYIFRLHERFDWVNIVSNSSRPCDIVGPFLDDRRELGVSIGNIYFFQEDEMIPVNEHLHDETLAGWHSIESHECRWTNGNARLNLKSNNASDIAVIAVEVKAGGPYREKNYFIHINELFGDIFASEAS